MSRTSCSSACAASNETLPLTDESFLQASGGCGLWPLFPTGAPLRRDLRFSCMTSRLWTGFSIAPWA